MSGPVDTFRVAVDRDALGRECDGLAAEGQRRGPSGPRRPASRRIQGQARDQGAGEVSRRAPLTHGRVLRKAVALADAEGFGALSMRRLGSELGVQAMSLYNHVANKDALLDEIVDVMVAEIGVPDPKLSWGAAMEARARSAREVLLAHRWLAGLLMTRVHFGPNMVRYVEATIGALRRGGFSVVDSVCD